MQTSWLRKLLGAAACLLFTAVTWAEPADTATAPTMATKAPAGKQVVTQRSAKTVAAKRRATKTRVASKTRQKSRAKRRAEVPFYTDRPNVQSVSVLVIDAANAAVLYAKRPDLVMPVASITKLMTALVVLDAEQPLDELIEINGEDREATLGNSSRLIIGTELTRGDLLHLALMSSENRAANALARSYPGGLDAFVPAMNAKAEALGMTSAHFEDATGLSSHNVSSAADLAKLIIEASRSPLIQEFSTSESYTVLARDSWIKFRNTNALVSRPDWSIALQKTGYTVDAGRCLVMKTMIKERPVLMVLLRSFGKYTRIADARRIRDWMEATWSPARIVTTAEEALR